uniref:cGMP-dependent protein kinase n=1 Tax=Callorhinchus milii TaxID=7868 RepID=A0A4W3HHJ6_CALMI
MGNGLVKPKHFRQPRSHIVRFSINATAEVLRSRLQELELENKRQDEQLREKECTIQGLEEQLCRQTSSMAELTQELQAKCVQLNKLQDVIKTQSEVPLDPPPPLSSLPSPFKSANRIVNQCTGLLRDFTNRRQGAKEGVSAEPTSRTYDARKLPEFSLEKARVRKDSCLKKLITDALNKNDFLKRLEMQHIRSIVECMYEKNYQEDEYVIKQGEPGNHLFVLAEGKLEVYQNSKFLTTISIWTTFGELAILYNCTRTASVKAVTSVKTWALDREVFQNIMRGTAEARREQYRKFLRSVSLLKKLPEDKLAKIVDCLEVEYYDQGDYIIREGEEGSTFFILAKGKVQVTQSTEAHVDPQLIKVLQKGDYFGEKALVSDDVRSANIIADENDVECLVIDRETFNQTVGTFEELQKYLQDYVAELARDDEKRHAKKTNFCKSAFFYILELQQEITVSLSIKVKIKNENVAFAMKCIKKQHVVRTRQQEHIHSEKKILEEVCSPFVVKLYRSFKDNKFVYMLLEACLGGEIWSILRDRGCFEEPAAKFCIACVTEAFDYLHSIGVIYRDLKPENLLLDAEGYIKLVDFGFAKKIGRGHKTWTFCGTPEYVAPEIILNNGHDFSVDFWSLGILVFELLIGSPPFSGYDQMMTYNMILKGIEKVDFTKKIPKRPEDLIRKLCKQNPNERLGNLKNGITDIKKHRWFNGFNWEGLKARTLLSPLKRELRGPTDYRYFDSYPPDKDIPSDELSGWDKDF